MAAKPAVKKAKTEVAKAAKTEVGSVLDFAADAGKGLEGADKSSFAIPFIGILQGLSPQLETVDGAKPGLFINTITNELMSRVRVIPCAFQRRYIRWAPRSSGGGFKGELNPIDVETNKVPGCRSINGIYLMDVPASNSNPFDSNGRPLFDHLSDTRNHFVLVETANGAWQPALISLGSSQIKKSKRWMSRIQGLELRTANGAAYNPPSFSHIYHITAVKEENAKGSWWGLDVGLDGPIQDASLYSTAKAFHDSVVAGAVEVSPPVPEVASTEGQGGKF